MVWMQARLGSEFNSFEIALSSPPPVSVRLNPQKKYSLENVSGSVLWNRDGYYLKSRPNFTLDPAFHAGAYYVQEASSMFLAEALCQSVDLNRDLAILDLCAAPGGKTTLLASIISPDSFVVGNELIHNRFSILKENVTRWGFPNIFTTRQEAEKYKATPDFFDVLLIDAPCSGEGMFRKDDDAIRDWSEENVLRCADRQKKILQDAVSSLKPGGVLIYSTCTYNDRENLENVQWALENFGLEPVQLNLLKEFNIEERRLEGNANPILTFKNAVGYQFYPHRLKGEGFFLAVLRKKGTSKKEKPVKGRFESSYYPLPKKVEALVKPWLASPEQMQLLQRKDGTIFAIPTASFSCFSLLTSSIWGVQLNGELGILKGTDFIPAHALALSAAVSENLTIIEVNKETALRFLKKEEISADGAPLGWALISYQDVKLGWVKVLKDRVNNYLPKNRRILMDLNDLKNMETQ